jgi:hypothetical protein
VQERHYCAQMGCNLWARFHYALACWAPC